MPELTHAAKDSKCEACSRKAYFGPDIGLVTSRVVSRDGLENNAIEGPLIIEDYEGTVVVPPDCKAYLGDMGNVIIEIPDN